MPLPTTPKFSADPNAKILGAWGDHFTAVFDNFYLIPTCTDGLSISIIQQLIIIKFYK